jgi:hypothetical protein
MNYTVLLESEAQEKFISLDKSIQIKIAKKLLQMERADFSSRHLKHGTPYFVEEIGQHRIAYIQDDKLMQRQVMFIGDHKEYEKWFKKLV